MKKIILFIIGIIIALGIYLGYSSFVNQLSNRSFKVSERAYNLDKLYKQDNLVPLVVLGSGPAGLSAALYGARAGIFTVVLAGPLPGGQLTGTSYVENWPATPKLYGADLVSGLRKQAESFGAQVITDVATHVDCTTWPYIISTQEGRKLYALSLILASGATPKRLGIPGENEYWGKGVSTCATCDAPYYKNKKVVVIGGGDSAVEEAIQLASFAQAVTIFVRRDTMRASKIMQERLKQYPNIGVKFNTKPIAVTGDAKEVTGITIQESNGVTTQLPIDGVFLAIGHEPNTTLIRDQITCDADGYITLNDRSQQTSLRGVYAAGDVSDRVYKQAGVAAGDGIKAALDAEEFLREIGWNDVLAHKLSSNYFDPQLMGKLPELPEIASLKDLEKIIEESTLPVVIDFFGPACPACIKILPLLQSLAYKLANKAKFIKVDVSYPGISEKFGIERIPTLVITKNKNIVARREGGLSKVELNEFLLKYIE